MITTKPVVINVPGYYPECDFYVYDKQHIIWGGNNQIDDKIIIAENMVEFSYCNLDNSQLKKLLRELMILEPPITVPLVLFKVLAIMKPLLRQKGFNVDGLLFLYGDTGTLKTSFASLVISDISSMLKVLDVNRKELHQKAKQFRDGLLFLDDMKLLSNKYKNATVVDFLDVVARCEDLATYPSILVTSEVLIGTESLQDRMIQVHSKHRVKDYSDELLNHLHQLTNRRDELNTLWYTVAEFFYKKTEIVLSIMSNNYRLVYGENSGYRISKNVGALQLAYVLLKECFGDFLLIGEEKLVYSTLDCIKKEQIEKVNIQRAKEFKCNWAREMLKILESKAFNEIKQESQIVVHKDRMYIPSRDFEKLFLKHYYPERMNINEICKELFALGILYVTEAKGYTCKYQGAHHYVINLLKMKLLCGK